MQCIDEDGGDLPEPRPPALLYWLPHSSYCAGNVSFLLLGTQTVYPPGQKQRFTHQVLNKGLLTSEPPALPGERSSDTCTHLQLQDSEGAQSLNRKERRSG